MEPEGSLPQSQKPVACPYPDPARTSPFPHIPLHEDPSYPPIYVWVSQVVSFLQVSPPKSCIRLSSHPYALQTPPVSFWILLPAQYWVRSTCFPVTTAWRVLRLRMEERPVIWRVAANILNKFWRTADKGWSFSLGVGRGVDNSSP